MEKILDVWNNTGFRILLVFSAVLLLTRYYTGYVTDVLYGAMVGGLIFAVIAMVFWYGIRPMILRG